MILVYLSLIMVALTWLSGRSISGYKYKCHWVSLALIALLLPVHVGVVFFFPGRGSYQGVALVGSEVVVVALLLLNRHLPGLKLAALGVALNVLVMSFNGWLMPIPLSTYEYIYPHRAAPIEYQRPIKSKNVALEWEHISMPLLADIIPFPWLWRWYAASPGDFLLMAGVGWFLFQSPKMKKVTVNYV